MSRLAILTVIYMIQAEGVWIKKRKYTHLCQVLAVICGAAIFYGTSDTKMLIDFGLFIFLSTFYSINCRYGEQVTAIYCLLLKMYIFLAMEPVNIYSICIW